MTRNILVATDGSDGAVGALHVAQELAIRDGSTVHVLAVYGPLPHVTGYSDFAPAIPPEFITEAVDALRASVRRQLEALGGRAVDEVIVQVGSVAPTIARTAADHHVDLIVVGMRDDGGLGRWRSRETLLRLVHLSHAAVMAVPQRRSALPRTAVVGIDFSDLSLRAATEAARELGPGTTMHLVHVITDLEGAIGWPMLDDWTRSYRDGVEKQLAELAEEISRDGDLTVVPVVREGEPADEILELARAVDAELIAVGSQGFGFVGRVILGTVSGKLVHQSHRAVLIAPPLEPARELQVNRSGEGLVEVDAGASEVPLPDRVLATGASR